MSPGEGGAAQTVEVSGLAVYSFLQDASGNNSRLRKGIERFRLTLNKVLEDRGLYVSSMDALADGAELTASRTVHRGTMGRGTGSVKALSDQAKSSAIDLARMHRADEQALPATHRLILLPERLTHDTGIVWGPQGASASGVNAYWFKVYWILEDVADNPLVSGYTTATLDIRGFPDKDMANQIASELERLGVHWVKFGANEEQVFPSIESGDNK